MSLTPIYQMIIDADAPGGVFPLLTAEGATAPSPKFVAGDHFDLFLQFARRPAALGGDLTYLALSGSWSIMVGMRASRLASSSLLASAVDFGVSGDGYMAALSLNTTEMLAVFATTATPQTIWMDIEIADAGNTRRVTYQFAVSINPQAYMAGETDPTPAEPEYPAPGAIPVRMVGSVDISPGATSVDIDVSADRDYVPVCVVRLPADGDLAIFVTCTHSLDRDGFTAVLSAAPEKEGYKLDYIAF